jgi:hypothetical protein
MEIRPPLTRRVKRRMAAGFLAVPPAIGIAVFGGFLVLHALGLLPYTLTDPVSAAASVGFAVGILAFLVTVAGALPGVLWLAGRGPLPLRKLLLLGAALGNAPLLLIIVVATIVNLVAGTPERGRELYGLAGNAARVAIGLGCGMVGAAVFWIIGVWRSEFDGQGSGDPQHAGERSSLSEGLDRMCGPI